MAGSKTETAYRPPAADNQKRRIRDTTQDRRWAARKQSEAASAGTVVSDATAWPVEQLLETHMDDAGNPVPDPVQFSDGHAATRMGLVQRVDFDVPRRVRGEGPGQDMVSAMNERLRE